MPGGTQFDPAHPLARRVGTAERDPYTGRVTGREINQYGRELGSGSGIEQPSALSPAGFNTPGDQWRRMFGGGTSRPAAVAVTPTSPTVRAAVASTPASPTWGMNTALPGTMLPAPAFSAPPPTAPAPTAAPPQLVSSPALERRFPGWENLNPEQRAATLRANPATHSGGVTTSYEVSGANDPNIKRDVGPGGFPRISGQYGYAQKSVAVPNPIATGGAGAVTGTPKASGNFPKPAMITSAGNAASAAVGNAVDITDMPKAKPTTPVLNYVSPAQMEAKPTYANFNARMRKVPNADQTAPPTPKPMTPVMWDAQRRWRDEGDVYRQ